MDSTYIKKRMSHQVVLNSLKEQFAFMKTLGTQEKNAIQEYSSDAYQSINDAMRESYSPSMSQHDMKIVNTLDNLFASVPVTTTELIVYRGIRKTVDYTSKSYQTGYHSTSYDLDVAKCFMNEASTFDKLLIIKIPVGSHILPIETISRNPSEHEILLPRWSVFEAGDDNGDILLCDTSNVSVYSDVSYSKPSHITKPILIEDFDEFSSVLTGSHMYLGYA